MVGGDTPNYCPDCGETVEGAGRFCSNCGTELAGADVRAPEPAASGASPSDESGLLPGKRIVLAGALAVVAGVILPWYSVDALGTSISIAGIDRDGQMTLVIAATAGAVAWVDGRDSWGGWSQLTVFLLGCGITAIAALYIHDPVLGANPRTSIERDFVQVGMGLYVTLVGGAGVALGPLYDKTLVNQTADDVGGAVAE